MNESEMTEDAGLVEPETPGTAGGTTERAEGATKRAILAGIGAAAVAYDTAEETFDRFVARGQRVQDQWQERADEVRQQNAGARWKMREYFRSAMDSFLDSLNVPSKTDVDTINVKLNILTRKLDDLQMGRAPGAPSGQPDIGATTPPEPPPDTDMAT